MSSRNRLHFGILSFNVPVLYRFREEFLQKIEKRVKEYKVDIIAEPRKGKKLLVLDIDYTLFGEF